MYSLYYSWVGRTPKMGLNVFEESAIEVKIAPSLKMVWCERWFQKNRLSRQAIVKTIFLLLQRHGSLRGSQRSLRVFECVL